MNLRKTEWVDMNLFSHHKMKKETNNMKDLYRRQMNCGMTLLLEEKVKKLRNKNSFKRKKR